MWGHSAQGTCTIVQHGWHHTKQPDATRTTAVGDGTRNSSSRQPSTASAMGLDGLMEAIRQVSQVSKYHINSIAIATCCIQPWCELALSGWPWPTWPSVWAAKFFPILGLSNGDLHLYGIEQRWTCCAEERKSAILFLLRHNHCYASKSDRIRIRIFTSNSFSDSDPAPVICKYLFINHYRSVSTDTLTKYNFLC